MKKLRDVSHTADAPNGRGSAAGFATGATVVERPNRGLLRLSGKDPRGMLNAVLTNDVPQDADGGVYALLLNPKGRIQADLRVLKAGEDIFLDTEPEGAEAAREVLGRYAPFSRVKLEDLSDTWTVLGLYGPDAGSLLGGLELGEHQTASADLGGISVIVAGVAVPTAGYDLIFQTADGAAVRDHLLSLGAVSADHEAYEAARVGAGVPRFGADMTPENFPGEAGVLDRAVSFQKGCYPGQETVARMRYRGHPNKTLHRLAVEGDAPEPGSPIHQEDKRVGVITSTALGPGDDATPALGYLSRKTDPESPLSAGGSVVRVLGEVS